MQSILTFFNRRSCELIFVLMSVCLILTNASNSFHFRLNFEFFAIMQKRINFLRTQQFDPIKTSKMKFDKEYVVDKFIENNLKNLTQSNLADLMSISVKVSKDLKRATLLKKHLPSLATQLKKLNIWGFRDASAVIYGLQYMSETDLGVLEIIETMTVAINHINANLNEKIQEKDITKLLSGLQRFSSKSREVLGLLNAITNTLQHCCYQRFTNKNISSSINSLTHMQSDSIEVRTLLSVLSNKLKDCNGVLESSDYTSIFFGLRGMNSECVEVRDIIHVCAIKLKESNVEFKASQLLNMLSCLSHMSSDYMEVRSFLSAINVKMSNCREGYQPNSMGNAINGLQCMSTDRREVRTILKLLSTKIRQNHDEWNSLGLSSAYFGMQRKSNCPESLELLLAIVAKVRNLKKDMSIENLGMSVYGLQDMDSDALEVRDTLHALNIELKKSKEVMSVKSLCFILFGLQNMKMKHREVQDFFQTFCRKIEIMNSCNSLILNIPNDVVSSEADLKTEINGFTLNDISMGIFGLPTLNKINEIIDNDSNNNSNHDNNNNDNDNNNNNDNNVNYNDIEMILSILYSNASRILNSDFNFPFAHCGNDNDKNKKEVELLNLNSDVASILTSDLIFFQQSNLLLKHELNHSLSPEILSKWRNVNNCISSEIERRKSNNSSFLITKCTHHELQTNLINCMKELFHDKSMEITANSYFFDVFASTIILKLKKIDRNENIDVDIIKNESNILFQNDNLYNIINIEIDSIGKEREKKKLFQLRRDNFFKKNGIFVIRIHSVTLETFSKEEIKSWLINKISLIEKL